MTAVRFALLELRRFRGRPLRYLAIMTIVALPLLYGTLHLWANWDLNNDVDQVPVAVVNNDAGAVLDGHEVNAGSRLAEQLDANNDLGWRITDLDDAQRGLVSGEYGFAVTIPAGFSAGLAPGTAPTADSTITIEYDRSHGDAADRIAGTIRELLNQHINTAAYATLANAAMPDLDRHGDALRHVRDTSAALAANTGDRASDASTIADDLDALEAASRSIADGIGRLNTPVQNAYAVLIDDFDAISDGTKGATEVTARAAAELGDIHDELCADRDDKACERLAALAVLATAKEPAATEANALVAGMSGAELGRNAAKTQRLTDGAVALADDTANLNRDVDRLATETGELDVAVTELAASLDVIASRFPSTSSTIDATRTVNLGSPIGAPQPEHRDSVGSSLAPHVIGLALWVFALVAYMVLRTMNPRALAGDVSAATVAVAGWLPSALLGVVAAIGLYFALDVGLGLSPANPFGTVGLCVLGAAVFCAIAHALRLAFPAAGDVVMIVLLMLQFTSVNGIYPVSTAPGFFRVISPYLPMTYLVDGLRVTIGDGNGSPLRDALILAVFGGAAVAVSTFTVMARRRWTIARLHPAIN